ncbi:DUF397 domain-containing protein [Kitasatospora purpeofusca]|uniref:DUF397 domain-containing protein n=1 Tax=Kitasatospora purpeofusca TaxID=67352 RepID=UPI00224E5564|nr:DUF397 domain-containing protein [Kitasatospora purpeofusca]MCX4752957.1 DUF397 domain-containing protein [Kitasatospora purpeofusca]WSR32499.1 DUF397 domain-containing protein [Kitasatospora purpeofusca]WSR40589.1 DUF397 domain-containing protein [Kitasatospora purpeofusca]
MEELAWQRPSLCADSSNCPEVAVTGDTVYIRSSLRTTEVTQLTPTEWRDLLTGIRNGEFDV